MTSGSGGIIGIGLDLVDLDHFAIHYGGEDQEMLERCFTEKEIADAGTGSDRIAKLAARFAAKEAVFKSLGGAEGVAFTDIEYAYGANGEPLVVLSGAAKVRAVQRGATDFLISVSHSPATAGAVVIALSSGRT